MDRMAVMETFMRDVGTGSVSAAARHLNVGQPPVAKSIAQLGEQLGVPPLRRSRRGLMPAEAGRRYHERARRAIEKTDEADLAARGASADLLDRLRVSAGVTFSSLHVVPRLSAFLAAHPHLSIDLILDGRVSDLIEKGVDVAQPVGTLRDSSLIIRKIATSWCLVLGAPTCFERAGVPVTLAEPTGYEAVVYTGNRLRQLAFSPGRRGDVGQYFGPPVFRAASA